MGSKSRSDADEDSEPRELKTIIRKWPKQTFLIIGNEFCERFSFYGMRAVLTLYFANVLNMSNSQATVFFHIFTVCSYSSPILGSILADGYIGKFWTIFSVSILYAIGQIVLAVSSISPNGSSIHPWLDFLGLLIISLGTGGIKPCVSAFGGDQFHPNHTRMISIFFSMFYFSINAGSLISMYVTPEMRSIPCLGNKSCYPLAFGIPAVLMIFATLVFMAGSCCYKKVPPKENVIFRVVRTICSAIRNKTSSSDVNSSREHWLDYSLEDHQCIKSEDCTRVHCAQQKFTDDIKKLIRVCVMLIPVPMFWALYDQQGSTWVFQAAAMNSRITDNWRLLPDQMGTLNAFLILVMIPFFQSGVYPMVERCGMKLTMLRKMAAGGILTAIAFIVCGIVQLFVNQSLPLLPDSTEAHLRIINTFPSCNFRVTVDGVNEFMLEGAMGFNGDDDKMAEPIKFRNSQEFNPKIEFDSSAPNCPKFTASPVLSAGSSYYLTLTPTGWTYTKSRLEKPKEGQGDFSISLNLLIPCNNIPAEVTWKGCKSNNSGYEGSIALCKIDGSTDLDDPCEPRSEEKFYKWTNDMSNFLEMRDYQNGSIEKFGNRYSPINVSPGTYKLFYISSDGSKNFKFHPFDLPALKQTHMGGVYTLIVSSKSKNVKEVLASSETLVMHNRISILWQIPQYFIITAGEVLFSITGLEFAYSEASPQLKSVVQALWLFTVAVGDLIDVAILALDLFSDIAIQMFVFGGMMFAVIVIFILLATFYYTYADYDKEDQDDLFQDKTSID